MSAADVGGSGFGAMLRWYRDAAGLTQEELAERSGVSVRAISDLERSRTGRPYRGSVELLAQALGLDDAAAVARPLLPGASSCLVLITSRNQLRGLIAAEAAHSITLDLLTAAEARDLLARRVGEGRVAAEPEAVEQIIAVCARLPLALTVVAARAVTRPGFPLASIAAELRDARGDLDAFVSGDAGTDVRAVFSWSYRELSAEAARLFRLLGIHPGPDISASAAASLAGVPRPRARTLLAELTRAHLIAEHVPGRYNFHDLLRVYAGELAYAVDTDAERRTILHRMLDHYLHTAHTADRLLNPYRDPIILTSAGPGVSAEDPADHGQALAWFTAEHPVLITAIHQAAGIGLDTHTWQLAWTLTSFFHRRGHWQDWVAAQHVALAAGQRLADRSAQAHLHRDLGRAYGRQGRYDEAHTHLRQALYLFGALDDHTGQARAHLWLGCVYDWQGRNEEALGHAQQALDLYRANEDQAGQARALNNIGYDLALLGEHQQALTYCRQALTLLQRLGARTNEAATWDSLGYAHHHLGDHSQAIGCYQHALDLVQQVGHRYAQADTLTHLGDAHQAADSFDEAHDAWQQALAILEDLRHPDADQVRAKLNKSCPS